MRPLVVLQGVLLLQHLPAFVAGEVPALLVHEAVALETGGVGERHVTEGAAELVGVVHRVQVVPHPGDVMR